MPLICVGCGRNLWPKYGRWLLDGDGIRVWVCYECMSVEEEKNE